MSIRNKLKGVVTQETIESDYVPAVEFLPMWSVGDIPITWEENELKNLKRRTLRKNLKSGSITKYEYNLLLKC